MLQLKSVLILFDMLAMDISEKYSASVQHMYNRQYIEYMYKMYICSYVQYY